MRSYSTIKALQSGEKVEIDGVSFMKEEGEIQPGDDYVGERNTVRLLTCHYVDKELGCIFPVEPEYPFDINECVKVRLV